MIFKFHVEIENSIEITHLKRSCKKLEMKCLNKKNLIL